jgi:hypothetical protein
MDRQQLLPVGKREVDDRLDDLNAGMLTRMSMRPNFAIVSATAVFDRGFVHDVHRDREGVRSLWFDFLRGGLRGVDIKVRDYRDSARSVMLQPS